MRVVLDTNVFVSGIFWSGPPYQILQAWQAKKLIPVVTSEILEEYVRVGRILAKKYSRVDISSFVNLMIVQSEVSPPAILKHPVSVDPDDDKFIACALSAGCKFIISGDRDLLNISGYENIVVIKPSEFVKKYL